MREIWARRRERDGEMRGRTRMFCTFSCDNPIHAGPFLGHLPLKNLEHIFCRGERGTPPALASHAREECGGEKEGRKTPPYDIPPHRESNTKNCSKHEISAYLSRSSSPFLNSAFLRLMRTAPA
jgi:hypothetical protein